MNETREESHEFIHGSVKNETSQETTKKNQSE
jgi:hypothetical protein